MEIPRETLILMLELMLKIRHFENRVKELFAAGEIPGFVHLYLGQEAIAAGVCATLNQEDYITSTHRGHGHIIAKGADMKYMMAELYGKATGYNKGKGGSQHIAWPGLGILGANGIVSGGIPIATGAAMSAKLRKSGQVAVAFFGDGASNEGAFHESLNIAAAFNLPVVYVCENNLYGVGTRQSRVRKIEDIADRASGYGMPGVVVDGNNVLAVYEASYEAVKRARMGEGPTLIECKTYRWRTHFEGEPDTYRPPEEVKAWMRREPIAPYRRHLIEQGIISADEAEALEQRIIAQVDEAVEFARSSPFPTPESALEDLWA
ncbi:MAG: thiamine pyrophosphate-dependent dehydrogenase E1 component subunit alpha [Anaerolineae bacterium]